MLFNSFEFVLFFPAVAAMYFALPYRFRGGLLLVASYFFYMCWEPGYLVLILISTLVDYWAALLMGCTTRRGVRRAFLAGSLGTNLGLLFFFKYYNFFREALTGLFGDLGVEASFPVSHFLLPVGISFYTFQTLSYTIEVYRGRQEPERRLDVFALYVAFFPQLVAGPIERASHLLPQLKARCDFDYDRVSDGVKLMFWGLFKKMVIADRLATFVDPVYNHPEIHNGLYLTVATVFFAFQIYCDFSGYTDIALGAARVFGVGLMDNFERPYFARSVAVFWRRWHISLSTWFRDYVYFPLGGNRVATGRWCFNVGAVFVLSGLWHGANWTFLVWGALHGTYLIASRLLGPWRARAVAWIHLDRAPRALRVLQGTATFTLVCFAWIFFRARNLADAWYVATHLFRGWDVPQTKEALVSAGAPLHILPESFVIEFPLAVGLIAFLMCVEWAQRRGNVRTWLAQRPAWVRFGVYSVGLWSLFLFGVFRQKEFIYFTF